MNYPRLFRGDVLWWAAHYRGAKFHALITDPPYHLTSITKRFGAGNAAPAQYGTNGVYSRSSRGFMGQQWDGGNIAFRSETWAALAEHLYPGAFGMAFASSRGWHRMAVAIEDAGLIIHPTIFNWAFGSGFPKATRVPDERFEGHRYGAQAIKPAVEPIIVFQKPYEGRPIDCITATGAGALNIDAGRIGNENLPATRLGVSRIGTFEGAEGNETPERIGRWPANFVLTEDAAKRLKTEGEYFQTYGWQHEVQEQIDAADPVRYEAKSSPAEREAGLSDTKLYTTEEISGGGGFSEAYQSRYQSRKSDRHNSHPTVKPIGLTEWLAKLLLPPKEYAERRILIPFAGSGSEMIGAYRAGWEQVYGIEMSAEYAEIARARLRYWQGKSHRTVEDVLSNSRPANVLDGQLGMFP